VWYEINYENFCAQNDPNAVTLSETVSIAACVRYIINFGGQRVISKKTDIRVLELQPGRGSHLTKAQVSGWTGIAANRITIDTMSTAEFIGKIDDLGEKYDLVYVGADTGGFTVIAVRRASPTPT
jgi:archaellum component FlaG (FlaF/FlaG flagellin family)